jgi:hypothetical protein
MKNAISYFNNKNIFHNSFSANGKKPNAIHRHFNRPEKSNIFSSEGLLFRKLDEKSIEIIGMTSTKEMPETQVLIVPSVVDGYTVTEIGKEAFKNAKFSQVMLPPTIRKIGPYAFSSCALLDAIRIPEGVEVLETGVFCAAYRLSQVIIPEKCKLTEIKASCFSGCSALREFYFSASIQKIDKTAFLGSGISKIAYETDYVVDNAELLFADTPLLKDVSPDFTGISKILDGKVILAVGSAKFPVYTLPLHSAEVVCANALADYPGEHVSFSKKLRLLMPDALVRYREAPSKYLAKDGMVEIGKNMAETVKVYYEGSISDWMNIVKLSSKTPRKVLVTAQDGTFTDII